MNRRIDSVGILAACRSGGVDAGRPVWRQARLENRTASKPAARTERPPLTAVARRLRGGYAGSSCVLHAGRTGSDGGRFRPDLGRAGLSLQPGDLGPVVGATRHSARSWSDLQKLFDPLTLLYYWPYGRLRHQFSPSAGGPVEPGDLRHLRSLDEGHPRAADGVGDRVRAHDHDRLSLPGAPVWGVGGAGDGRFAAC